MHVGDDRYFSGFFSSFFFFFSIAQGRVIRYLSDKYVSSCIMD